MVVKVSLLSGAVTSDGALSIQTNAGTEAIGITTGQVISLAQNPILSAGTINGVAYLNGSKILTTGSALVFDSTNTRLGVGNASPNFNLDVLSSSGASAFVGTSASSTGTLFGALKFGSTAGANAYIEQGAQIRGYAKTGVNTGYLSFYTSNGSLAEQMRLDEIGNLGLGVTPSAWGTLKALEFAGATSVASDGTAIQLTSNAYFNGTNWIYKNSAGAGNYYINNNTHNWRIAGSGTAGNTISFTQAMTLDASGNLGVGTTPSYRLDVSGDVNTVLRINGSGTSGLTFAEAGVNKQQIYMDNANLIFYDIASSIERMRLDSSGNLLVGDTSSAGKIYSYVNSSTLPAIHARQDGTAYIQSWVIAAGAMRAYIKTDGGLGNYSANNVNLSDERMKTDISLAGNYLSKICAIPVKTFKYKGQTDDALNLGVIAQDVEAVAPELVDLSGWGAEIDQSKDGVPLKAIYQTDLQYALMKCIQEQQALIQTLTSRLEALEAK